MSGEYSLYGNDTYGNTSSKWNVTANPNNVTPEITLEDFDHVRNIRFHLLVVILPIGLFFNCFFIGVYGWSWLRKTVPAVYFITKAVSDNIFLMAELLLVLESYMSRGTKLEIGYLEIDVVCKTVHFLRYSGRLWSSWITVAITIERFITVSFPFKVQVLCTRKKAKITLAVMCVACVAISSFAFWTIEPARSENALKEYEIRCIIPSRHWDFYRAWLFTFFGMGELLIPSLAVALFTGIIIWKLSRATAERNRTIGPYRSTKTSKESQPTMALLSIAITFVLLRLPYIAAYYINEYKEELWSNMSATSKFRIYTAYSYTFVLATLTYSISFLLFCITGQTFRRELRRLFTCKRTSPNRGSSYANTYSTSVSVKYDNCATDSPKSKGPPDLLNFKSKAFPREL